MKATRLTLLLCTAILLAGCSAQTDSNLGSNEPGDAGDDNGTSTRLACADPVMNILGNPDRPYALLPSDSPLPDGFGFFFDLQPSCLFSYEDEGVVYRTAYFFGVTEDEAKFAYASAAAWSATKGWTTLLNDANPDDGMMVGQWGDSHNLVDMLEVGVFLPLGETFAPNFGADVETNMVTFNLSISN